MKLEDVKVGEKYIAKVSGKPTTVRITNIEQYPAHRTGRRRTQIHAVNERTGRFVVFKSAQRLRKAPQVIGAINSVNDLSLGERAYPELDVRYDLRSANGEPLGVNVVYVKRVGDSLVAYTDADRNGHIVSGIGTCVLCPKNR